VSNETPSIHNKGWRRNSKQISVPLAWWKMLVITRILSRSYWFGRSWEFYIYATFDLLILKEFAGNKIHEHEPGSERLSPYECWWKRCEKTLWISLWTTLSTTRVNALTETNKQNFQDEAFAFLRFYRFMPQPFKSVIASKSLDILLNQTWTFWELTELWWRLFSIGFVSS
jgi:hypothetical protein